MNNGLDDLFAKALEIPKEERSEFLNKACPDQKMQEKIWLLLNKHENIGSFLEGDAETSRNTLYKEISTDWSEKSGNRIGTKIEKYTIEKEIGRGGRSTVYQATREEEDWHQTTAIKVLRRGIDTDDVLHRFHVERQILAQLSHPGIASILDAGVTDDGLPWFAMELVDGCNIIDFCNKNNLGLKERLKLFIQVTEVVSFAHRHLIVHRDIKPSNILVDKDGNIKLLDFGISKVLEVSNEEMLQVFTRTDVNPSTPDYAAPEQLVGDTISTATDVYQMGLLLSKMLTGELPVATGPDAKNCERISPKKLSELSYDNTYIKSRSFIGDIDTIVLKTLRQEPENRYTSIDALSDDIQHYLGNRPIEARPPSLSYRMTKFIRRQPWALPVGTFMSLLIVIYLVTVTIYNERLQIEKNLKTIEAERAEKIKVFLVDFLRAPDPYEGDGHDVTMQQALGNAAIKAGIELAEQPDLQAEVFGTLAIVYRNLDLHKEAVLLWGRQLAIIKNNSSNELTLLKLRRERAYSVFRSETSNEAVEELNLVKSQLENDFSNHPNELARTIIYIGQIEQELGDLNKAADYFSQAISLARSVKPLDKELLANALLSAGRIQSDKGQYSEAFKLINEAENLLTDVLGVNALQVIQTALAKADTMARMRKNPEQALTIYENAATRLADILGPTHKETISAYSNSAYVYNWLKQHEKAEFIYKKVLTLRKEKYGDRPEMSVVLAMISLGTTLSHLDRNLEAVELLVEARSIMTKLVKPGHYQLGYSDMTLVHIYEVLKNYSEMERVAKRALDLFSPVMKRGRSVLEAAQCRYAGALMYQGKYEKAKPLLKDSIEVLKQVDGPKNIIDECEDYLTK